jgi:hypothetical protein
LRIIDMLRCRVYSMDVGEYCKVKQSSALNSIP